MLVILARLINSCWFCFKWGLLLTAIGVAVAAFYVPDRVDEEIRCRVLDEIAGHYDGLDVAVQSAALVPGKGIRVLGLSIAEREADGPRAELLFLREMFLHCDTNMQKLITEDPRVDAITLRDPTLQVTHCEDGSWSVEKLLPLPQFGQRRPPIIIENATVRLFDPQKQPSGSLTLNRLSFKIEPPSAGGPTASVRRVGGTCDAENLRHVEFAGFFDTVSYAWQLGGHVKGLEISREMRATLPEPAASQLAVLDALQGQVTFDFRLAHHPEAVDPFQFTVAGTLDRAKVSENLWLPYSFTELQAKFCFDNSGVRITDLKAGSDQTRLAMSVVHEGYQVGGRMKVNVQLWDMPLDQRLAGCLERHSKSLAAQWDKFLPAGVLEYVSVGLLYDGQRWTPTVEAHCGDVSFSYYKHPYRLEHGKGTVKLENDVLTADLTATGERQPVKIDATIRQPTVEPVGEVAIRTIGEKGLPLNERLFAALPEKSKPFIEALHATGSIHFDYRMQRNDPNRDWDKDLVVSLGNCAIRYEKFPYPLAAIHGTLRMKNDHWKFENLVGRNDGEVRCSGYLTQPGAEQEMYLEFEATGAPLDEELRMSLRPAEQRVWTAFQPRGKIDLTADVRYRFADKKLDVGVKAWPCKDQCSIKPEHFCYRMEKLEGVLDYRNGEVQIRGLRAQNGPVSIRVPEGVCRFLPNGRWLLDFKQLTVDRLKLDEPELTTALPKQIKDVILALKPKGPIDLDGRFTLEGGSRPGEPVRSRWQVDTTFFQGEIDCGVVLENLSGVAQLEGEFDGRNFRSWGSLNVDTMTFKGFQFTQLTSPIWLDDRQVLVGRSVAGRGSVNHPSDKLLRRPRPLTAKLCEGTVAGDAWVILDAQPRYGLTAQLHEADLSSCAQEVMAGRQNLHGDLMAAIDLRGTGRSVHGLKGKGSIQLRNAEIYELPLIVSLLKILNFAEPDPTAFTESDIDFVIDGPHIYFRKLNFSGDAISLLGQGMMNFDTQIQLTFKTIVGRGNLNIPVIKDLFRGTQGQLMAIYVGGTLQEPEQRGEAFPGVNQMLRQLELGLNPASGYQPARPAQRPPRPNMRPSNRIR